MPLFSPIVYINKARSYIFPNVYDLKTIIGWKRLLCLFSYQWYQRLFSLCPIPQKLKYKTRKQVYGVRLHVCVWTWKDQLSVCTLLSLHKKQLARQRIDYSPWFCCFVTSDRQSIISDLVSVQWLSTTENSLQVTWCLLNILMPSGIKRVSSETFARNIMLVYKQGH